MTKPTTRSRLPLKKRKVRRLDEHEANKVEGGRAPDSGDCTGSIRMTTITGG